MKKTPYIAYSYILTVIFLFLYSFTQIDLNLTLSRWSIWQVIEKSFQYIGYFNRPLSSFFYLLILLLLFGYYIFFLTAASKKILSQKIVWTLILITAAILVFSYNALSYDIFNYIFDARIVTHYHQNPYIHKALDFPGDHMLHFMRWTHRVYPYGPVWLGISVILSFIGFQVFLPTLIIFKLCMALSFLGSVYCVEKISEKISPTNTTSNMVFFGMNPLIIIESLVSAHNDIVMIFFYLLSIYLLLDSKYTRSLIMFILSVLVKYTTVLLAPVFIFIFFSKKFNKQFRWEIIIVSSILFMIVASILTSLRTNFQPWYLLYPISVAAFLSKRIYIIFPTIFMSFFALLQYVPYLYIGDWNPPVPMILFWLTFIPIVLSFGFLFFELLRNKRIKLLQ